MKLKSQQLKEIEERVEMIPGDNGWGHRDNSPPWYKCNPPDSGAGRREPFKKAAVEMVQNGFTIDRAIELLTELYRAAISGLSRFSIFYGGA